MVDPEFERRRPVPPSPHWFEAHLTLADGAQGSIIIWTSLHPDADHAEQACVVWPTDDNPIVMIEADIPIPHRRWEFRTSGLWVEQVCETPNEHWSYGLESFALELDDPTELTRTGFGTRVPLGWELDFYHAAAPRWILTGAKPLEEAGAYTQPGALNGVLLDAAGEHEWDGHAQRWHWWGSDPLSGAGIRVQKSGPQETQTLHLRLTQGVVVVQRTASALTLSGLPEI